MQEVLSNVSKVMVENKSGSNLLYLPLDKLIRERGQAEKLGMMVQINRPVRVTYQVRILALLCEILLVKVGMVLLII